MDRTWTRRSGEETVGGGGQSRDLMGAVIVGALDGLREEGEGNGARGDGSNGCGLSD